MEGARRCARPLSGGLANLISMRGGRMGRQIRYLGPLCLLILGLHLVLSAVVPALAQQDQAIECVKRSAAATPPPFPAVPQPTEVGQRGGSGHNTDQTAARARAVCADTDVPVIREIRPERPGYGKGNPLLRPETPAPLPGAPQNRGALTPAPSAASPRSTDPVRVNIPNRATFRRPQANPPAMASRRMPRATTMVQPHCSGSPTEAV